MLAMKLSPLKLVKSLSDNFDTSLSMSFKKKKLEDNKLQLNTSSNTNMQTKNINMNSPR